MNPIRRELTNGLLVLVVASLLSAAFSAFQVSFNLLLWVLILMGIAIAVGGYVVFAFALSASERERVSTESTRRREEEWLKRVGTPAPLELNQEGDTGGMGAAVAEIVNAISPGSDYTVMYYFGPEGGAERRELESIRREKAFSAVLEQLKHGRIREYKRIMCFDHDLLANYHELKAGLLRVGEGPGTIDRAMGEHCRVMLESKGCSLFVAPAVLRSTVILLGADKVAMTVETAEQVSGGIITAGILFFSDPPNGEIVEQFRQMERETERRMVAVHRIVFPEDADSTAKLATR